MFRLQISSFTNLSLNLPYAKNYDSLELQNSTIVVSGNETRTRINTFLDHPDLCAKRLLRRLICGIEPIEDDL